MLLICERKKMEGSKTRGERVEMEGQGKGEGREDVKEVKEVKETCSTEWKTLLTGLRDGE